MNFGIDKHKLDDACIEQSQMAGDLAERLPLARMVLAKAKDALALAKAETGTAARDRPADFNLTKVTDSSVADAVLIDMDVRLCQTAVIEAQYEVDVITLGLDALGHRKGALRDLVQLWQAEYYADVPMPGSTGSKRPSREDVHAEAVERSQRRRVRPEDDSDA